MATSTGKGTTAADIAAAVRLGTMDPSTIIPTTVRPAVVNDDFGPIEMPTTAERPNGTEHACDIPGCRHGAAHSGITQPDRQIKLQCPACGAVARMTAGAYSKALGITCHRDGASFAQAERRTYSRKAV